MIWVTLIIWNFNIMISEYSRRFYKKEQYGTFLFIALIILFTVISEAFVFTYILDFWAESLLCLVFGFAAVHRTNGRIPKILEEHPIPKLIFLAVIEVVFYLVMTLVA